MSETTDMAKRLRNDHLLNMAYTQGKQRDFSELEILKRFTLMLLDLKDEAFQEKIDELMKSCRPVIKVDKHTE